MDIPPEVYLSYFTDIEPDVQLINALTSQQKTFLLRINDILKRANLSYLSNEMIAKVDASIGQMEMETLDQDVQNYLLQAETFFNQSSTKLDQFIAQFKIEAAGQDVVKKTEEKQICERRAKLREIYSQKAFDIVFECATKAQRQSLSKHEFAATSSVFFELEKELYFSAFPLKQVAKYLPLNAPICDIVRCIPELGQNPNAKQLMERLLTVETLRQYPQIARKCFDYIATQENVGDQLFQLRAHLRVSDKEVYEVSAQVLAAKKQYFGLSAVHMPEFFELFDTYMTEKDFKSIYRQNQALFAFPIAHNTLQVIALLAASKQYSPLKESQIDKMSYWQICTGSDAQHLEFIICNIKIKNIQLFYLDEYIPYQELMQIAPHYQEIAEHYSTGLTRFSVPLQCKTRIYSAVFQVGGEFYGYTWTRDAAQSTQQILQSTCIRIDGDFNKSIRNGMKSIGSHAEIAFSEFDERKNVVLTTINKDHAIREISVEKPQRTNVCQIAVAWEALVQSKFQFTAEQVGYKLLFQGQQQFIRAQQLHLKLFATDDHAKRMLVSRTFALTDATYSLDLDENELFYAPKLLAEFSARVGDEIVTASYGFTLNKRLYLFCKQFVYEDRIMYHFYNKNGPVVGLNVDFLVNFSKITADADQLHQKTDVQGFCTYSLPDSIEVQNVESVDLAFEYYDQKYHICNPVHQNKHQDVQLIVSPADGRIKTQIPTGWSFQISGVAVPYQDGYIDLAGCFAVGQYELVLCGAKSVPQVVATLQVVDKCSEQESELILFFETKDGILAPSWCKIECSAVLSNQYYNEIKHSVYTTPYKWVAPLPPEYTPAQQFTVSEQQQYLRDLPQAFADRYQSASIAQKPPCLFLKEELAKSHVCCDQLMDCCEYACDEMERGVCRTKMCRGGPRAYGAMLGACAAPGCYMDSRCDVEQKKQPGVEIEAFTGVDPFVSASAEFSVTNHDGMHLVQFAGVGPTCVQVFAYSERYGARLTKTRRFSGIKPRDATLVQPELSHALEFADAGTPFSIRGCFSDVAAAQFAAWTSLNEHQKITRFRQLLCYELAFFIKLNDSQFWATWGQRLFGQRHARRDVVSAFLLDDLHQNEFNFAAANQVEQFLLLMANCGTTEQRATFIAKCRRARCSAVSELIAMSRSDISGAEDVSVAPTANRAFVSVEQGWLNAVAPGKSQFTYCRLFADILQGTIEVPDLLNISVTQRNMLLAFLWQKQWFLREVALAGANCSASQMELELLVGRGKQALLNQNNSLTLSIKSDAQVDAELSIRFDIIGAVVLREGSFCTTKMHKVTCIDLGAVYVQNDFDVAVRVYQNQVLCQKQILHVSAMSTEDLDLEKQLQKRFLGGATAEALFSEFAHKYSRMSTQAFARVALQLKMPETQLRELYSRLYAAGIFNPYLLSFISDKALRQSARFVCLQGERFYNEITARLVDKCPSVSNCVLRKKNISTAELSHFISRALFTGESNELFFYLVKCGQLRAAEQLLPRVSQACRFQPIVSYFKAMLFGAEYSCAGHFNRFNSQAAARSERTEYLAQFGYQIEAGKLIVHNPGANCELALQKWKYGNATRSIIVTEAPVDLGDNVWATLLHDNRAYLLQNSATQIKWQKRGNVLRLFEDGKPAVGLLVVERNAGKIVRAAYSDFRGQVLLGNAAQVEVYESLEKSFVVE